VIFLNLRIDSCNKTILTSLEMGLESWCKWRNAGCPVINEKGRDEVIDWGQSYSFSARTLSVAYYMKLNQPIKHPCHYHENFLLEQVGE